MCILKICEEKLSVYSSAAYKFINEFSVITEGYSEHQIFNCDEIGLYFKMLLRYTFASVNNRPDGTKKAKGRMTINDCANVSGTIKLPLLLIGKTLNPRSPRNLNKEALPAVYHSQKMLGSVVIFLRLVF